MNERQRPLRSLPHFACMIFGSAVSAMNLSKPLRFFEVESENSVSRASEMRVMDGAASDSEIACIAAIPASQVGKKYA